MSGFTRALLRNTAWYGGVTVIGLVSGVVMSIILARGLGPSTMGDFAYVVWALRILEGGATLGFALATVRYTAAAFARGDQGRATGFLRMFVRWEWRATLLALAIVIPLVWWFAAPALRAPFLVAVLTLVPLTIEGIYMRGTYGAQRYDVTARVSVIKMTLNLALTLAAIFSGTGLLGIFVAQGLATTTSCLLQRRQALRLYPAPPAPIPAEDMRDVRTFVVPLSVVVVLDMLVWDRSELFLLKLYVASKEIAFYSLAFGLSARAMIVPGIVVGALLPALSALDGIGDDREFEKVYRAAVRYAVLVGTPIAAILGTLAPSIILFLYGEAYLPVADLLRALVLVAFVGAVAAVPGTALQSIGARRAIVGSTGTAFVIDMLLALLLIPSLGTWGAVVATSAAQVTASIWAFTAMYRMKHCRLPAGDLVRILVPGVAAVAVAWMLSSPGGGLVKLVAAGLASGAVFVVVALLTGAVGPREWGVVRESARRMHVAPAPQS